MTFKQYVNENMEDVSTLFELEKNIFADNFMKLLKRPDNYIWASKGKDWEMSFSNKDSALYQINKIRGYGMAAAAKDIGMQLKGQRILRDATPIDRDKFGATWGEIIGGKYFIISLSWGSSNRHMNLEFQVTDNPGIGKIYIK